QLHKCVSDTNQHYMSNDDFLTTRFTTGQIQVLLDVSEKYLNGPTQTIPQNMLLISEMESIRHQVLCSSSLGRGVIFDYRQLYKAVGQCYLKRTDSRFESIIIVVVRFLYCVCHLLNHQSLIQII